MNIMESTDIQKVCMGFEISGTFKDCTAYGNGHINSTYFVRYEENGEIVPYILQHMNSYIFKEPEALMENIISVTGFLRKKISEAGGDPDRETLNFVRTLDGHYYYVDEQKNYWRMYHFIDNVYVLNQVEKPEDFYQTGLAFGHFQRMLADFPAETLHETIQGFHDTKARFQVFKEAVERDICGRAAAVQKEINFVLEHEELSQILGRLQASGNLPLRVTHNDTKSNNVLIDNQTNKGLCVIDLDTVMPGLSVNDYGDSIRFGASTAAEDEPDLTKVSFSLELYEAFTKGFMESCGKSLTSAEIQNLPNGAKVMTYECGMRFLTDYLSGDTYFKIAYPDHNLVRARTQFKLVSDMEEQTSQMNEIINKYL